VSRPGDIRLLGATAPHPETVCRINVCTAMTPVRYEPTATTTTIRRTRGDFTRVLPRFASSRAFDK
jgi:hypothetical protein